MDQTNFQHDSALGGCDGDSHMVPTAGDSSVEAMQSYGPPAGSQAPKAADLRIRDGRSMLRSMQARRGEGVSPGCIFGGRAGEVVSLGGLG